MTTLLTERKLEDGVLVVQFEDHRDTNPMSDARRLAIIELMRRVNHDASVTAVVLYGGQGKSFCAGGDFVEVQHIVEERAARRWIEGVMDLYRAVLECSKPAVAAVGGHAVGIGFQLALCCDLRVGSDDCVLSMPELRHGIACTIGGYMLDVVLGRAQMMDVLLLHDELAADHAERLGLLNTVVRPEFLLTEAIATARRVAGYPAVSFRETKSFLNESLIDGLTTITEPTITAHARSFAAGTNRAHFNRILGVEEGQAPAGALR